MGSMCKEDGRRWLWLKILIMIDDFFWHSCGFFHPIIPKETFCYLYKRTKSVLNDNNTDYNFQEDQEMKKMIIFLHKSNQHPCHWHSSLLAAPASSEKHHETLEGRKHEAAALPPRRKNPPRVDRLRTHTAMLLISASERQFWRMFRQMRRCSVCPSHFVFIQTQHSDNVRAETTSEMSARRYFFATHRQGCFQPESLYF